MGMEFGLEKSSSNQNAQRKGHLQILRDIES